MPADPRTSLKRPLWRPLAQRLQRAWLFGLKVLAVPIGLAGSILLVWGLVGAVQRLSLNSKVIQIWLSVAGVLIVADALLTVWELLPADDQSQTLKRWQGLTNKLLRSRALGLWPVLLVLLTSLVGLTDWFPASGQDRLIMLASIATVAIYGYFREQAEKRRDLLAFADEARDRFAEAAQQIHEERDREIEERERSTEIDRLIRDLEDSYGQLKEQARSLNIPFRDLVDTFELRKQLNTAVREQLNTAAGFSLTDLEFQYILTKLGLDQ